MPVLLDTAYFPPIQYFAALSADCRRCNFSLSGRDVSPCFFYLEACENYQKQSYRNRCNFYSASGMQSLSFPVVHEAGMHNVPVSMIRVDYSTPWLTRHKRAIVSAYRTSAYFEYYQDELFAVLDRRPDTLWELNLSIIRFFLDKLGLPVEPRMTVDFTRSGRICTGDGCVSGYDSVWDGFPYNETLGACDLREVIHPKRKDDIMHRLGLGKPYFQVFARKYGFIPNLSIMDLLFNEGPDAISYLIRV